MFKNDRVMLKPKSKMRIFVLAVLFITYGLMLIAPPSGQPTVAASANTSLGSNIASDNNGQLNVVGNHIVTGNGKLFIPEGISIYGGLEDSDYNENVANIRAQIIAAAKYWHANTVRLQIAESNLLNNPTPGKTYNEHFLEAIISQVKLIRSLNMAVVLNDQTEFTNNTPSPTTTTVKFWNVLAHTFKNSPYIIFDLFNEPRLNQFLTTSNKFTPHRGFVPFGLPTRKHFTHRYFQASSSTIWNVWKYGGEFNGAEYVGTQTLVNQIRGYGAKNLIWVEGPNEARELPSKKYLIQGSNIEYSIHHPDLNKPSSWAEIGNLAEIAPVVDGEWAQYQSPWTECFSTAYTNAPLYLNYLHAHGVGIIAWSLQAGSLVRGGRFARPSNLNSPNSPVNAADLRIPTHLTSSYDCGHEFGQGVGKLLQNYFARNSAPLN